MIEHETTVHPEDIEMMWGFPHMFAYPSLGYDREEGSIKVCWYNERHSDDTVCFHEMGLN